MTHYGDLTEKYGVDWEVLSAAGLTVAMVGYGDHDISPILSAVAKGNSAAGNPPGKRCPLVCGVISGTQAQFTHRYNTCAAAQDGDGLIMEYDGHHTFDDGLGFRVPSSKSDDTSPAPAPTAIHASPSLELFVATSSIGTDTAAGNGTAQRPFPSVGHAIASIRSLSRAERCAPGGVTVTIAGGVYGAENGRLYLTSADSSCGPEAPLVFRAAPKDTVPVVLHGGVEIPASAFKKEATIPGSGGKSVWSADLGALGLSELAKTSANFTIGWKCANGNRTELFFNGRAMTLARYPNKESGSEIWQYLRQGVVLSTQSFGAGTDDTTGGKPIATSLFKQWRTETESLWVHGFWSWDWADSFVKVAAIGNDGSVALGGAPHFGLKSGSRYMMTNAKSLLDAAEEYYIDGKTSKLYFIPPDGADPTHPSGQGAFLSLAQTAHTIDGAEDVILRGLRLEYAMGVALSAKNVTSVTIDNCTISNSGTDGIHFTGKNATLSGSEIVDIGCNAVVVSGGDIHSLTPGHMLVHNNSLHRFGRVSRTVRVGVSWSGCGNVISSNEIYDAPQIGIIGHGVNTVFEDNDLHDLAKGTADTGGFYAGRTWSDRGNIVRRNKFRRFYQVEKMAQKTSVNGIYLDDMEAGWTIEDNYFESIHDCMFIGGGRQNTVRANTFVNCTIPVHVDDRGKGWMHCGPNQTYPKAFLDELAAVNYRQPPWSTAFPHIDVTSTPCAPTLNIVRDNRYCFLPPPPPAPSPPPPPAGSCAKCPTGHPYPYGSAVFGSWCCSVPHMSCAGSQPTCAISTL